jgi:hypothetical protein
MKRTPLRKKRKPLIKDNEYYRKKCVELAKRIVRHQAEYKCAYCGMGEPQRVTHGSHIYSEGANHGMSADLDNILCLCWIHHGSSNYLKTKESELSWHKSPAEAMDWFREKYPERAEELRLRHQHPIQKDFKKHYEELKEIWNNLING